MRTLVVDDDELLRLAFAALLESRGHEVVSHETGEAALAAYAAEPFGLVLLDWMLPGMDGLELCRRMRELPHGDRSLILVVTAKNSPADLEAVLRAGADDYIAKPVDLDLLSVRLAVAERTAESLQARKRAEAQIAWVHAEVEKSLADTLAILDGLRLGTGIADAAGQLTYVSRFLAQLLAQPAEALVGTTWREAFGLSAGDLETLAATVAAPLDQRDKVAYQLTRPDGRRFAVEVEVLDEPRDPRHRIFVVYDVTDLQLLRREVSERARFHDLVGRSAPMQEVYQLIRDVAPVDATVLINGATGTGKELVARAIHNTSHRAQGPFVAVNCAGLSDELLTSQLFGHKRGAFTGAISDHKGVFEAADGGTIFLDEIGDISARMQTSLLRVLQEKEITRVGEVSPRRIDTRVLAATNRDLGVEVEAGRFRADLFYRIRVARIQLPPLVRRREDIPLLVNAFLARQRAVTGKRVETVGHGAMRLLMAYPWPGNVRELASAVEFAVIRCKGGSVAEGDLPQEITTHEVQVSRDSARGGGDERERVLAAIEAAAGNRSKAAKIYGVSRATFYRILGRLELT